MNERPNPQHPEITDGGQNKVVAQYPDSVARQSPQPETAAMFEDDRRRSVIGDNAGAEAFYQAAREAERLEHEIAQIEQDQDQGEQDAKGRLAPLKTDQIVAAFVMARLVDEGTVPMSARDDYISAAGIRPHGNATVPHSDLMRAVIAKAELEGAPKNKRKRARASSYANAIYFALSSRMTREALIAAIDRPRRKGERAGIEFLAGQGRALRKSGNQKEATANEQAGTRNGDLHGNQGRPSVSPAELDNSRFGRGVLNHLAMITARPGAQAVVIFRNVGPNAWVPVESFGPMTGRVVVRERRSPSPIRLPPGWKVVREPRSGIRPVRRSRR